jgi:predicted nucleic acid-binding protein
MGSLNLPVSGLIYVDTSPVIYSVEKTPDFYPWLLPLWQAAKSGQIELVTSELTLLESLVVPLRRKDTVLIDAFERALTAAETDLAPITIDILRDAAQLRADTNLKTPDAIHAATALAQGCVQFITNDPAFRRVTGLNVVVLSELI